jgi:predicted TIM-barrel fold metal-dependent hydrolase
MGENQDRLLVVSADGHAVMPPELWAEYLEPEFHDHLPRLAEENRRFSEAMLALNDYDLIYEGVVAGSHYDVCDPDGVFRAGQWAGAWDRDIRLAEMDREGVAAEFVFNGYFRATDLFFNVSNTEYPPEVAQAGVRAHDRWLLDNFGDTGGRLMLVGAMGRCLDRDAMLQEATWIADHGFVGTYVPGFASHPDLPPLDDEHWDPMWALCAERGLTLIVHGGYGLPVGTTFEPLTAVFDRVRAAGGSDADAVRELRSGTFNDGFFADTRCRQPLWQMMLGGVFDRHPDLRLMMTEVRGDWIPATLARLDAEFEVNRADLPSKQRPSELWQTNCMAGLSFLHRVEVEHRHEIGVEQMSFGRDYPHSEGTWPNTRAYLHNLFVGVPEDEARKILGENLARFLRLERSSLAPVVERIGFTADEILTGDATLDPALEAHLNARCGLSKPFEGDARLAQLEPMLADDLARLVAR